MDHGMNFVCSMRLRLIYKQVSDEERNGLATQLAGYYPATKTGTRKDLVDREKFYKVRCMHVAFEFI
jgi:hypothetical protein